MKIKELTKKETYNKKTSILFNSRLGRKGNERAMLFSNFQPFTFTDNDGVTFHSTEQRFQWLRLRSKPEFQRKILTYSGEKNGWDCKAYVTRKQVKPFVDLDVERCVSDMRDTLKYKVLYCPKFKDELIATGNQTLVEYAPWGDDFWGAVGSKGNSQTLVGSNVMGKLLMELREELTQGKTTVNTPVEPPTVEVAPTIQPTEKKPLKQPKQVEEGKHIYADSLLDRLKGDFIVRYRIEDRVEEYSFDSYGLACDLYQQAQDIMTTSNNPCWLALFNGNNIIEIELYN